MPGVFGFGGKPSGPDGDRQGGSGVLGVGGTADYDFPVPLENDLAPGPGVYGIGGVHFNTGVNGAGVVGASGGVSLSGPVPQLPPFQETRDTGVVGMAAQGTGVKGMAGTDGAGVVGVASGTTPPLASQLLRVGVLGVSAVGDGVKGYSRGGPGVDGYSEGNRGGVLGSSRAPQLRLVPANIASPTQLGVRAEAGDLLVTVSVDERGSRIASLWFCTVEGTSTQANWVKLA